MVWIRPENIADIRERKFYNIFVIPMIKGSIFNLCALFLALCLIYYLFVDISFHTKWKYKPFEIPNQTNKIRGSTKDVWEKKFSWSSHWNWGSVLVFTEWTSPWSWIHSGRWTRLGLVSWGQQLGKRQALQAWRCPE